MMRLLEEETRLVGDHSQNTTRKLGRRHPAEIELPNKVLLYVVACWRS